MGPLSGRPPLSTRRSRESMGGGGGGGGGGAGGWSEVSGATMSSGRRVPGAGPGPDGERVSGSYASWMRKLEERYQKLHKKIAAIPSSNTSASRFNFLTRRFFNETLAKAQQRRPSARRTTTNTNDNDDKQEWEEEDEEEVEEAREEGVRRKANTAPEPRGPRADSPQTEQLLDQPAFQPADRDSDSERDLNDENLPPPQLGSEEGGGEREGGEEEGGRGGGGRAGGLAGLSVCVHCGTPVSTASAGPLPFKPTLRAALSLDDVSHRLWRAPLLERDNRRQGAARPAALQALAQRGTRQAPPAGTQPAPQPQPSSQAPRQRSAKPHSLCRRCAKHGLGAPAALSALPATRTALGTPGGGGERRGKRGSESGPGGGWIKGDMGDLSGVRALNPVSASGRQMYGGVMRPAQAASHYSHSTTKSCPAALASSQPPSASRRRRSGGGGAGLQESGRQKMQVFAHMSLEARHAITETLREMGQQGDQEDRQQRVEDSTPSPDNDPPPPSSLPSTQPPSSSQPQPSAQPPPPSRRSGPSSTQAKPRAPSLSASQRTGSRPRPQPRTTAAARQAGDATSSVTATVKGCRSPRRPTAPRKAPSSTVQTSQPRGERLKSARTLPDDPRYCHTYDDGGRRNGNDINDDDDEDEKDVDEEVMDVFSMASTANVSSNLSSSELRACGGPGLVAYKTHLPAITSRTEPHAQGSLPGNGLRHVNYRIRGVGSYRVARERTFEITAPDFDIRYRDVITCQKGDRDTPPPDIFEKSVGKVRDWLNKYFFAS